MAITSNDLSSFGTLLKDFRKRRRLTQQQFAGVIGVHRSAISRWEQGDFLPASKTMVLELARHLHLDDRETRQLLEASLTALAPPWDVPLPRNPYFTGREELLEALHSCLGAEQAVALTQSYALHGLGGIGKTQIALEYAYRYALEYDAVFWIEAETGERVASSLLRIAETLQLPERKDANQPRVMEGVRRWLNTHHHWLLIWDNLNDLELLHRFLPRARQGAILITTRSPALGTLAVGLDLLPMGREEGMLLVLRRAKVLEQTATREQLRQFASDAPADYAAAEELVTVLGGLPLALDQAGAYVEETGCSLGDYLQRYQQQGACLLARRGSVGQQHPRSVAATFQLSSEQVGREQKAAAELLRVCALLHAEDIPEELFAAGAAHLGPELEALCTDAAQFDQALAVLRRLSLVQRQARTHTLSLHRLVQAVLRESMSEQSQAAWLKRVIAALNAAFPEADPHTWGQCERLLPHVLAVATAIPESAEDWELAEALQKAACYLCDRSRYEQAEPLFQRALRIGQRVWEPEHPQVASTLCDLAYLYYELGQYQRAEPLFQRARSIWEHVLGPAHPVVARPLHGLGTIYWKQGKYDQGERAYQRACSILEQALGPEHPQVALLLNGLALLAAEQGQDAQAERFYQQSLGIRERQLGPEHPQTATSLDNLAYLYFGQGKYAEAEPLYQRALRIREKQLGPDHLGMAYSLNNLAELYGEQGRYAEAKALYQRSWHIWQQTLGSEHPDLAHPLNGLAILYTKQGKYKQAEPLYQRALSIRELHLGQDHPETAQTLHDLAILRRKQGNLGEARAFAERALKIRSQSLGDAHPKTVATRALYTQLLQEQTRAQKAAISESYTEEISDARGEERSPERTPSSLHEAVTASPSESDPLRGFLDACCELHPRAWCQASTLWQVYTQWAQDRQERFPLSRSAFVAQLKAHGCQAARTNAARTWRGIALVSTEP